MTYHDRDTAAAAYIYILAKPVRLVIEVWMHKVLVGGSSLDTSDIGQLLEKSDMGAIFRKDSRREQSYNCMFEYTNDPLHGQEKL